jgi:hypothetical protein
MQTSYGDPTRPLYPDIIQYADLPWFDKIRRIRELIGNELDAAAWLEATSLRLTAEAMPHERLAQAARHLERLARDAFTRRGA